MLRGTFVFIMGKATRYGYCFWGGFLSRDNYKYKKIKRGWIVINTRTGAHSHFKSQYGCYLIMKFLKEGIYPDNEYLRESYDRLENSKDKRQRYNNEKRRMINQCGQ